MIKLNRYNVLSGLSPNIGWDLAVENWLRLSIGNQEVQIVEWNENKPT